jgi:hypothetical protein
MSFRVEPVAIRAIAKALSDNTSLHTLDVTRAGLKDDVGVELAKSLETNAALTRLDAEDNKLGPSSLAAIGGSSVVVSACIVVPLCFMWACGWCSTEALQRNSTLTTLSLDRNPLTNGGTNYYGLQVFARALSVNTTLKTLSLFGCGLSAEVCRWSWCGLVVA